MEVKLYEISDEISALLDQVDPETGEYPDALIELTQKFKTKGQSVVAWRNNKLAKVDMMKAHVAKINALIKREEKQIEWSNDYLLQNMKATGISEIKANDGTFSAKIYPERDESVDIFDPNLLPNEYWRVTTKKDPDKTAIKNAIKGGLEIQGARILKKDRLVIK